MPPALVLVAPLLFGTSLSEHDEGFLLLRAQKASIERVEGGSYDLDDPKSVKNQLHPDHLPATLDFGRFHITSASLSDVLSVDFLPPFGLLVSEKAMTVLRGFTVGAHVAYPVTVVHDGRDRQYFWVQLVPESSKIVFARSTFVAHDVESSTEVRFASLGEMMAHATAREVDIEAKAIAVERGSAPDLMGLPGDLSIYASMQLVRAMADVGLTGFEAAPTTMISMVPPASDVTASLH
jgi:hypothetical protein